MKVLLYTEGLKKIGKSGLGKAIKHQMTALENEHIEYTLDPKDEYDILHINTWFPKSYYFAKKEKKKGKKIVYHAHSTEEDIKNSFLFSNVAAPVLKKLLIKAYGLGDAIVTPTPYSKRILERYKGLENKKIYAISNGIEMKFFKKDSKLGKKFRNDYGYTKEDKIIIGIGLYIERKGILDFVEMAKRLPQYKFIWFGYSPLAASPRKIRKAVKTKLPNLCWAGYVERDIIKGAMSSANLFFMPTLEETEGIPLIEACATKQNILVRDIPIWEGWLEDGKNIYKGKNQDEYEEKIKGILEGTLPSLVNNAYSLAEERDLSNVGKQLKEVYNTVMSQK